MARRGAGGAAVPTSDAALNAAGKRQPQRRPAQGQQARGQRPRAPVEAAPPEADVSAALDALRALNPSVSVSRFAELRWELLQATGELLEAGQRLAAERANRAIRTMDAHCYHAQVRVPRAGDVGPAASPIGCGRRVVSAFWGLLDSLGMCSALLVPCRVWPHLLFAIVLPLLVAAAAYQSAGRLSELFGWPAALDARVAPPEKRLLFGVIRDVLWSAPMLLVAYPMQYVSLSIVAEATFARRWQVRGGGAWSFSALPGVLGEVWLDGVLALMARALHSAAARLPPLCAELFLLSALESAKQQGAAGQDTQALTAAVTTAAAWASWVLVVLLDAVLFSYFAFGFRLERQDMLTPGRKLRQVERCWHYFAGFALPAAMLRSVASVRLLRGGAAQRALSQALWGAMLPLFVAAASGVRAQRWQHAPWRDRGPCLLRPAHSVLTKLAPSATGRGST
eukprot:TRINITY_DN60319_c0_g1_i1.p1 TRINITY_DN60319_c0_g1~~TRINITY_DN60319_c0_g1_i1.p1  ORF type:complete len:453 (+),score=78.28 TRINITY_DN60319_c0_g1_i1:133-1491(+)